MSEHTGRANSSAHRCDVNSARNSHGLPNIQRLQYCQLLGMLLNNHINFTTKAVCKTQYGRSNLLLVFVQSRMMLCLSMVGSFPAQNTDRLAGCGTGSVTPP